MPKGMSDPVLRGYMQDMTKHYPGRRGLSVEEEQALARRARRGDKQARARLVETHLVFVFEIAKRFRVSAKKMDFLDLIQEGNRGLMKAANTFQPGKGRFARYAAQNIEWRILQELRRDRRQEARETALIEESQPSARYEPEDREATTALLKQLLGWMTERSRRLVIMHFGLRDGVALSATEIARRLGVERSGVSVMIHRALLRAKKKYEALLQAAV